MTGYLDHVPLSWHRMPEVTRDEDGRLRSTGRLTDQWRGCPVGWIDHTPDGVFAVDGNVDGRGVAS